MLCMSILVERPVMVEAWSTSERRFPSFMKCLWQLTSRSLGREREERREKGESREGSNRCESAGERRRDDSCVREQASEGRRENSDLCARMRGSPLGGLHSRIARACRFVRSKRGSRDPSHSGGRRWVSTCSLREVSAVSAERRLSSEKLLMASAMWQRAAADEDKRCSSSPVPAPAQVTARLVRRER